MSIPDNPKTISREIQEKMEDYRNKLLIFGMKEPNNTDSSVCQWRFFKKATELTAFIVNLTAKNHYIEIVYGYSSIAFTRFAGCENALNESGVSNEEITIREKYIVYNDADEENLKILIFDMYKRYLQTPKDDLLTFAKEKRKAFINQITLKLKPLGFKKKSNTWTRPLVGEYYLMFNAQKSSFSDTYYFNMYIGKNGTNEYGDCYYTRLAPDSMYPIDWQALSEEKIDFFFDQTVVPSLNKIIITPLNDLGKISTYWLGCHCKRNKCEFCWIQKNLWDLIEEKTFHLQIETTEGLSDLEVKQTIVPQEENIKVTLTATIQGVLHSYESNSTEATLLALAKNLPDGWKIVQ